MKTRFLLLTFLLLGFVSLQAQDGEIIYSDSINVCDFSRNGYPSEGTHFDIDGDSIYDFHTTAGITAINEATEHDTTSDNVEIAVIKKEDGKYVKLSKDDVTSYIENVLSEEESEDEEIEDSEESEE